MIMSDGYLWDGSGEPDPEIQKLETALGKLRHNRAAPTFPEITVPQPQPARRRFWPTRLLPRFAVVAAGILAITAISFMMLRPKPNPGPGAGWNVTRVTGTPRIGPDTLGAQNATGKLGLGQMLKTDRQSQANIRVEEVGEIVVGPDTRLRLPDSSSGVRRL